MGKREKQGMKKGQDQGTILSVEQFKIKWL